MARSLAPMLFSFTDREASPTLIARVGAGLHPGFQPQWCKPFPLQKGVHIRSIALSPRDGRPELVYLVGVSIRSGRGRYRDTQIVTFAPCYQLYNQSSWRLEVTNSTNSLKEYALLANCVSLGVSGILCNHFYRPWSAVNLFKFVARLPPSFPLASTRQRSAVMYPVAGRPEVSLVRRFYHTEHFFVSHQYSRWRRSSAVFARRNFPTGMYLLRCVQ